MKHHVMLSRIPLKAQTDTDGDGLINFEPGDTSFGSKMNFLVAFFGQSVQLVYGKTGSL